MTDHELKSKMDELGMLMHSWEEAQRDLEIKFQDQLKEIEYLKEELKAEFLKRKESMKSQCLDVRYRKGTVRWETKWLEGYSVAHPEIREYRKEGQPTVTFLVIEEGWDE